MIVHVVIDLIYGDEGNPGIKVYKTEDSAFIEEQRLLAQDPKDGTYLVIREKVELLD